MADASTPTPATDAYLANNARYAQSFSGPLPLPLPPSRHVAVLACMDADLRDGLVKRPPRAGRAPRRWPPVDAAAGSAAGGGR